MPTIRTQCGECGATLPPQWPKGLCPQCALEEALAVPVGESQLLPLAERIPAAVGPENIRETQFSTPKRFGDFIVLRLE